MATVVGIFEGVVNIRDCNQCNGTNRKKKDKPINRDAMIEQPTKGEEVVRTMYLIGCYFNAYMHRIGLQIEG